MPAPKPSERLRLTTIAVRVHVSWMGVRKRLSAEQTREAAETFDADQHFLSAGKKIIDTRHPAYRELSTIKSRATAYWKATTLPYPEPGVRLIKQESVEAFNAQMATLRGQLTDAVLKMAAQYEEMRATAKGKLGALFSDDDYPSTLDGLFSIEWDFPSVEPPEYLLELSPAIYEQERARVAARFEEAVALAEQGFLDEMNKLVTHLTDKLSAGADGEKKVFRDSALTNLTEFFDRFQTLNVRSNAQLEEVIARAKKVVQNVDVKELRGSGDLRTQLAQEMGKVKEALDGMLVNRPRRSIVRKGQKASANGNAGNGEATAEPKGGAA